jgi:DNA modification methylase
MATGEMSEAEFTEFLATVLANLARHCIDGAVLDVCMDWRHLYELLTAGRRTGLSLLNLCVWNKDNGGMGSLYRSKHELVCVFKKGTAPHVNNIELGRYGRYRTNVWDYAGVNGLGKNRLEELAMHPTVKPTALVADAIKDCSRRGDIVLDAFAGSGTTLIAAEKTGRRGYGLELDPRYVDVAVRRWERLTGKKAVHAETGLTIEELAAARRTSVPSEPDTKPRAGDEAGREVGRGV